MRRDASKTRQPGGRQLAPGVRRRRRAGADRAGERGGGRAGCLGGCQLTVAERGRRSGGPVQAGRRAQADRQVLCYCSPAGMAGPDGPRRRLPIAPGHLRQPGLKVQAGVWLKRTGLRADTDAASIGGRPAAGAGTYRGGAGWRAGAQWRARISRRTRAAGKPSGLSYAGHWLAAAAGAGRRAGGGVVAADRQAAAGQH